MLNQQTPRQRESKRKAGKCRKGKKPLRSRGPFIIFQLLEHEGPVAAEEGPSSMSNKKVPPSFGTKKKGSDSSGKEGKKKLFEKKRTCSKKRLKGCQGWRDAAKRRGGRKEKGERAEFLL